MCTLRCWIASLSLGMTVAAVRTVSLQARIEQRARQIAEEQRGAGTTSKPAGLRPSETQDLDNEGVVTDAQLNEELVKVASLDIDAVREEQQKYMKEKRALNIARKTWFESFKEREGRPPTDQEVKDDLEEIDGKLQKLDEIVAALQKRSVELAKDAWGSGQKTEK